MSLIVEFQIMSFEFPPDVGKIRLVAVITPRRCDGIGYRQEA